jgi:ABC transport system ATP-binding/permease protein
VRRAFYTFYCPNCHRLTRSLRGKRDRCRHCRALFSDSVDTHTTTPPTPPPNEIAIVDMMERAGSREIYFGRTRRSESTNPAPYIEMPLITIAPLHFVLARDADGFRIEDIVDDYPTYINGQIIGKNRMVGDGDVIEFGGLRYELSRGVMRLVRRNAGVGISIRELGFRYAASTPEVFRGLNLEIDPGEFAGVFGESGCGKSTLLRLIADVASPSVGRRSAWTGDITLVGDGRTPVVAYVPQEPCLLDGLTVEETFRLFADLFEIKKCGPIIRYILSALGLNSRHVRRNRIERLSGGQRRRVNVGVELLRLPDVILLDEPDASLDKLNRFRTLHYLATLRYMGVTVVVTTHNRDYEGFFDKEVEFE